MADVDDSVDSPAGRPPDSRRPAAALQLHPVDDPTFARLRDAVLSRATHRHSHLHGEAHWRAVAYTALELAPGVPGADPLLGLLFGLLHDSQRLHDGNDPDHGPRAARLAQALHTEGLLPLDTPRLRTLVDAIDRHTVGRQSNDPTIAICWDADRLNLWRIGVKPHPAFLSTAVAREPAVIAAHESLPGQHTSWTALYEQWLDLDARQRHSHKPDPSS